MACRTRAEPSLFGQVTDLQRNIQRVLPINGRCGPIFSRVPAVCGHNSLYIAKDVWGDDSPKGCSKGGVMLRNRLIAGLLGALMAVPVSAADWAGLVSFEWRPGAAQTRSVWDLQLSAAVDAGAERRWQPVTGLGLSPQLGRGVRLFGAPAPNRHFRMNADGGQTTAPRIPWWAWAAGGVALTVALVGGSTELNNERETGNGSGNSTNCGVSGDVIGPDPIEVSTDCPGG